MCVNKAKEREKKKGCAGQTFALDFLIFIQYKPTFEYNKRIGKYFMRQSFFFSFKASFNLLRKKISKKKKNKISHLWIDLHFSLAFSIINEFQRQRR